MRFFVWLFRAALFFALFAFALNNRQDATVRWFFGHEWHAPMVIVVLIAFAVGCGFGVLAMVPSWWRHRRDARKQFDGTPDAATPRPEAAGTTGAATEVPIEHPSRVGL